jgi:hypothetical protein
MNIHWQGNRSDVTAESGEYTLTAKLIDPNLWQWHVYHDSKLVDWSKVNDTWPNTRIAAQRAAEKAMNEHINKQQSEK